MMQSVSHNPLVQTFQGNSSRLVPLHPGPKLTSSNGALWIEDRSLSPVKTIFILFLSFFL